MPDYGQLIQRLPNGQQQTFLLDKPTFTIGSAPQSDIRIDDPSVANQHARIDYDGTIYRLFDLGTASGTFINNVWIDEARLLEGNLIRMGNSSLRFTFETNPTAVSGFTAKGTPLTPATAPLTLSAPEASAASPSPATPVPPTPATGESTREPILIVIESGKVREIPLTGKDSWTIGSAPGNEIALDDPQLDPEQARIEREGDTFVLHNEEATNDTATPGAPDADVAMASGPDGDQPLHHADVLTIGDAQLVFQNWGAAQTFISRRSSVRPPVVFIPGIFGSNLWQGSEQIWPSVTNLLLNPHIFYLPDQLPVQALGILNQVVIIPGLFTLEEYSRLTDYLVTEVGYTRGKDLLEFAYDWRQDLRLSARRLAERIEKWNVNQPITIIAHSMGCLVSRYYTRCMGGASRVDQQILMGGPNHGLPSTLTSLLAPDLQHLLPMSMQLGRSMTGMFATFPSNYQFLPINTSVVDQNGEPIDLYRDTAWYAPKQSPLVQAGRNFWRDIENGTGEVSTLCVFGYTLNTVTGLEVTRDEQGNWVKLKITNEHEGDGFIPTVSAILKGSDIDPVRSSHNSLYVNPDVLYRLKLELGGYLTAR